MGAQFFGGVFVGIGIGCPYLPIKLGAFAIAFVLAIVANLRRAPFTTTKEAGE